MFDVFTTHVIADYKKKDPFFFSPFLFDRMNERGNTHFCFHCSSDYGFLPDENGNPTNLHEHDLSMLKRHKKEHENAVIGNADKYKTPEDWLRAEIAKKENFPYLVTISN